MNFSQTARRFSAGKGSIASICGLVIKVWALWVSWWHTHMHLRTFLLPCLSSNCLLVWEFPASWFMLSHKATLSSLTGLLHVYFCIVVALLVLQAELEQYYQPVTSLPQVPHWGKQTLSVWSAAFSFFWCLHPSSTCSSPVLRVTALHNNKHYKKHYCF